MFLDRYYIAIELRVVFVVAVGIRLAVAHQLRRDLDVSKRFQHLQFLLDLLLRVYHEKLHLLKAKVVRDVAEELVVQGVDLMFIFAPNCLHQFLEDAVSQLDVVFTQLAKRHLLGVIADLHHLPVHHVDVEDEIN